MACGGSQQKRRCYVDRNVPAFNFATKPRAPRERHPVDDAALLTDGVGIRDAVRLSRFLHVVGVAEGPRFLGKVQKAQTGGTNRLKSQEKRGQHSPYAQGRSHAEKRQGGRRLDNRPPLLRRSPRSSRSPQSMF
jgi:hypothetical protein